MAPFVPTLHDIHHARSILVSLRLPNELALCILDQAHYWLELETESREHVILVDGTWSLDYSAAYPYLYVPAYQRPYIPHLKIREVAFTIVSHDQGWTTEDTQGTYQTSSWFEVSIIRPKRGSTPQLHRLQPGLRRLREMNVRGETVDSVGAASNIMHPSGMADLVRRPASVMEPQRLHCPEMMAVKSESVKEGEYAWYLQGNEVAREKSVFEGEMVKRYHVTWGCKEHPVPSPDKGVGSGDGFIDTLEQNDFICVWARAKVSSTSVYGIATSITELIQKTAARVGEPHPRHSDGDPIHDLTHVEERPRQVQATQLSPQATTELSMKILRSSRKKVAVKTDPVKCSEGTKLLVWRNRQ